MTWRLRHTGSVTTAISQDPPSADAARIWTGLSLMAPVLLPVAAVYQRRAFREANESNGRFEWRRSLTRRPVLLYAVVLALSLLSISVLFATSVALGVPPV